MATIKEVRSQYPQYADMSDAQLAMALHRKYYSDVPMVDYLQKVGVDRGDALYQLRAPGDKEGDYLRQMLAAPGAQETPEAAAKRQGGAMATPSPGLIEGGARALQQGATFGWGDELIAAGASLLDQTPNMSFGEKYDTYLGRERGKIDQFRKDNPVAAYGMEIAGSIPTGMGLGGQLAGRGSSVLGRMASAGAVGFGQGAVYGAGTSEGDLQGRAADALTGGAIGFGTGAALQGLGEVGRRFITPKSTSPSQRAAADLMEKEGVTLTAGQKTGSKGLQYLEAELGGGKAANMMDDQARQFTAAVLKRAGVNADQATPEVMNAAFENIGTVFNKLESASSVPVDAQVRSKLASIVSDYLDTSGMPARGIQAMADRIEELAANNRGILTGEALQNIRSKIGGMIANADGPTAGALRQLQDVLDDAIERNLSPQLQKIWQQARGIYKNLLVVERAVTSRGASAADGIITPAALRSAAITQGRRSFARGRNDFARLANAGVKTMTPLPQSGTTPRLAAKALGAAPGAAIGAIAGSAIPGVGTLAGAAAGAIAPPLIGRAMLSRMGRAYLGNQLLSGPSTGGFARTALTPSVTLLDMIR